MTIFFILFFLLIPLLKIILILGTILFVFNLFVPIIGGAPYLPISKQRVIKMIEMSDLKSNELLIDLGSGDGRILIEAARLGAIAIGYEINPLLVYLTRRKIKKLDLEKQVKIYWRNFWRADVSGADVVTIYGINGIMKKIEKKLLRELKPGARVCSYLFSFSRWSEEKKELGIYFYKKL